MRNFVQRGRLARLPGLLRFASKLLCLLSINNIQNAVAHFDELGDLAGALCAAGPVAVVTAPPGAGKSTVLPLRLLESIPEGSKILMLEPRRLAARQVAERLAWNIGEPVGKTVGYRIRFESKVSRETRLEVLTEGILTRMLVDDPTLDGVGAVIFDEFHERSLVSDEALALTREIQSQLRPDLRIVIMSATIDAAGICSALDAPQLDCAMRRWPVDIVYSETDLQPGDCVKEVVRTISRAHSSHEGDILAFLPGEAEIRRCAELLEGQLGPTHIYPLYGQLSFDRQRAAIAPSPAGERKVVLATPIAETSITIEGVRIVVDSGFCRTLVFDGRSGLSHLETVRISLDMADQRTGRAGRVAAGVCYRLWTESTSRRLAPCRRPEILDADLAPLCLDVAAWGEADLSSLAWLTPPPAPHLVRARELLKGLGAVSPDGMLTERGSRLASLPCHPIIASMLISSSDLTDVALAADIAAITEERDPMSGHDCGADIDLRIDELRRLRRKGEAVSNRRFAPIVRAAEQYRRMMRVAEDNSAPAPYASGRILAAAYPDRIAKLREEGCGRFLLSSGAPASLDINDPVAASEWLVAADLNSSQGSEGRIFLAASLRAEDALALSSTTDRVAWDAKKGCVVARKEWRIGRLLVDARAAGDVPRDKIVSLICEAARKDGPSMFDFSDSVGNLQRRVAAVASWHPELSLPDISTESVLDSASEWLPLFVGNATTAAELKKIDLEKALWSLLTYDQQQAVDRLAPTHIEVPTGSRIRLEYRQGAEAPVLRVRLQECFGLLQTPAVDSGRRPVLMELLSPGFKPVQLTSDLASFWRDTYFEVRKELRRRYPRHSWPDDPLEAPAVRGVKRH